MTDEETGDVVSEQAAAVYERNGRLYFHGQSKTTAGVWILCEPFLSCAADDPTQVGRLVRACLSASRGGVAHPTAWSPVSKRFGPLLRLAKVRSYKAFASGAKCVDIRMQGERIVIEPTRNLGPARGWEPLPEKARQMNPSDERLGLAVIGALASSE